MLLSWQSVVTIETETPVAIPGHVTLPPVKTHIRESLPPETYAGNILSLSQKGKGKITLNFRKLKKKVLMLFLQVERMCNIIRMVKARNI